MAINKKLIHFLSEANFNTQLAAGNILDTSICFIKDAKKIYTHGEYYATPLTVDEIESIVTDSNTITEFIEGIIDSGNFATTSLLADEIQSAKSYTDSAVADLVNGAPDTLDTLDELAAALKDNADIIDVLDASITNKVDKVSGKGLSTNDYTTDEKTKLAGIATGAEVNVQSDWNVTDTSSDAYIKNKPSLATVATSGSYSDLSNKPTIDTALSTTSTNAVQNKAIKTEIDLKYTKPSTGIPKTDLASAVLTSLDKADTALQSYTEQYTGTITGVSANGTSVATSGVANIPAASTSAYGVTKLSSATNSTSTALAATASAVKAAYDLAASKTSNTGTITGITMNGSSKGTSGVVDLGTVITDISGKQDISLKFTNISASSWVSDSTYSDFPYRCDMACSGVTADMYAEVTFTLEQATSGVYAPICETKSNIVSIWASTNSSITVPTIIITK